jgi:hypothetical protein
LGLSRGDPRWARPVGAAVVRDLHDIHVSWTRLVRQVHERAPAERATCQRADVCSLIKAIPKHLSGWSSTAIGSWTFHQSSLWHWTPDV